MVIKCCGQCPAGQHFGISNTCVAESLRAYKGTSIKKIIIQGISGSTSQTADWREFEFIGLGVYQDGDRRNILSVSTNLETYQYPPAPEAPLMTANDWVSGGKTRYTFNDQDNSLALKGTQTITSTKNFTFEFTGGTLPSAADFTKLRIYFDRPQFTASGSEGTWSLIAEDQNGDQYTRLTSFTIEASNRVETDEVVYVEFVLDNGCEAVCMPCTAVPPLSRTHHSYSYQSFDRHFWAG